MSCKIVDLWYVSALTMSHDSYLKLHNQGTVCEKLMPSPTCVLSTLFIDTNMVAMVKALNPKTVGLGFDSNSAGHV